MLHTDKGELIRARLTAQGYREISRAALLVPMMVIFRTLGILNTYPALILAESTHAVPFAVWLLTNYFASLPRELEEAAQVDGCDRIGAMPPSTSPARVTLSTE